MAHWVTSKEIKVAKWDISVATILAAVFFAIAHIKWTVSPFTISADPLQLVYCLILGTVYGIVYQKTESVLYPMLMHSFTNVIAVGLGFIRQALMG
jgi:membrane protease YdiL (CAAX protease family)